MGAALGDHDAADGRGAAGARLPRAGIDLMTVLECASFASGVHIVGNRGPARGESFGKNLLYRRVQAFQPDWAEAGSRGQRMDPGKEKSFVHIDIAQAGKDRLVQEDRLQAAAAGVEAGGENLEREVERVRTETQRNHSRRPPAEAAELADVVKNEQILVELQQSAGMGPRSGIPKKLAGHPQVNVEGTRIEAEEEVFAQAVKAGDACAGEAGSEFGRLVVGGVRGQESRSGDDAAGEQGRKRAADGLDFGKFRHGIRGSGRG